MDKQAATGECLGSLLPVLPSFHGCVYDFLETRIFLLFLAILAESLFLRIHGSMFYMRYFWPSVRSRSRLHI